MSLSTSLIRAALLIPIIATGSALNAQTRTPATATLDSIALANVTRDHTVGAVVGIVRSANTVFLAAFGKSDVEANTPMRTDAVFAIGSISKQFTAAALLQLRDQGKLSLDDDITKWLPDFDTRTARITLRRLLDHSAGIPDVTTMPALTPFRIAPLQIDAAMARDSIYSVIRRSPLRFTPGSAQMYSSAAFWLLHRVVEQASGMPYHQYLERMIFAPLGMSNSGVCHGVPSFPRRATGYGVRNGEARRAPESAPVFYFGSGELCSSVADMVAWLQGLHGGKVLSPASYAEMTSPSTLTDGTSLRYGLGVDVREDASGNRFIGHSGEIAGYAARANWYPDAQMAIVVLMNNSFDSSPTALVDALAAQMLPSRLAAAAAFRGDDQALVGTYKGARAAGPITIELSRGAEGLMMSINAAAAQPLLWVEGLTFRQGGVLLTFRRPNGGSGPATELRYDVGTEHAILTRS